MLEDNKKKDNCLYKWGSVFMFLCGNTRFDNIFVEKGNRKVVICSKKKQYIVEC